MSSSVRPANYGGDTTEWSFSDLVSDHDQVTGQYQVTADDPLVDKDGNKIILAGQDITKYFTITAVPSKNGTLVTFSMNKDLMNILNLPVNKQNKFSWTAYVQAKRIKDGEAINEFMESYNKATMQSNKVRSYTDKKKTPSPKTPQPSTPQTNVEIPQKPNVTPKTPHPSMPAPQPSVAPSAPVPQSVSQAPVTPKSKPTPASVTSVAKPVSQAPATPAPQPVAQPHVVPNKVQSAVATPMPIPAPVAQATPVISKKKVLPQTGNGSEKLLTLLGLLGLTSLVDLGAVEKKRKFN